ncbi:MAG TPA: Rho termination factor N-terminal domain-containing protein [Solirubrobacterales bacterium]|nr:Rho termination factor N-terminal domain-containing protein [Solirubrobacterales bacterium]
MSRTELADLHLAELHARAAELGIEGFRMLRRDELVAAIGEAGGGRDDFEREEAESREPAPEPITPPPAEDLSSSAEADTDELEVVGTVIGAEDEPAAEVDDAGPREADEATEEVSGVLELTRQRFGFIRLEGLHPAPDDVYISASQVRRCELRPGDHVAGPARAPRRGERHRALVHVDQVNGVEPLSEARPDFDALAPILPERRVPLDSDRGDVLLRAVDLLAPLALGQRVLVRAAPRSGRTTLLRGLARAVSGAEGLRAIVLLVDERPEEATAWREAVADAEFAIATADLAPRDQVHVAELALERARRLAEDGADAVLLCDSLSRLALAAGDAGEVKRLFGSGRNLAGGGSLTVIATVLDGGRDEGEAERAVATTESSLVTLDPELAGAGVVPALVPARCRVSNEDQLRDPGELEAVRRLRSLLADLDPREAATLLRERIEGSASNAELLAGL